MYFGATVELAPAFDIIIISKQDDVNSCTEIIWGVLAGGLQGRHICRTVWRELR